MISALVWTMPLVAVAAPVLSSLNYTLADTAGGDSITITGTNLGSATACTVGGTSATITANTSTSLTFTMPAKTAGSYNVQVTTAAGPSNTLSIEAFSDTGLTLAALFRNYGTAGTWPGIASAGASSGKTLSMAVGGQIPTVGTTIHGDAAIVFDGVDDRVEDASNFWSAYANTSTAINTTLYYLVNVSGTLPADPGAGSRFAAAGFLADTAGAFGVSVHTGGVTVFGTDGTYKEATAAFSTGTWQFVQVKLSPTAIAIRVNGGSWSTTAWSPNAGQPALEGRTVRIGRNYSSVGVAHQARVFAAAKDQQLADAVLDRIRALYSVRYGISL